MKPLANLATFDAYADQFEKFIHDGATQRYEESTLFGSLAACVATGLSAKSCSITRTIAAYPNANRDAKVWLAETAKKSGKSPEPKRHASPGDTP